MITDYAFAELFWENGVEKNYIITDGVVSVAGGSFVYNNYTYLLTNDDLSDVPKIYEMLTDEKDMDFGRCNSNRIEFKIAADVIPLIGKTCRVYLWMNNDKDTLFKIGKYRITSDKATADRNYRDIIAYDQLYDIKNADVTDWYNSLFPLENTKITVRQMRKSFCRHFNIDDATNDSDMVNDDVQFGKTIAPSQGSVILGETILMAFCSINGGFGNMSRNGDFRCIVPVSGLIGLYPREDLYPDEDLLPREDVTTLIGADYYIPPLAYEDYYTEPISMVQIRETDDDLGVAVGEEGNSFILEGNFILFGKGATELEEIATRLLNRVHGMSYMPFSVRAIGNPCFEVGDPVRFRTGDVVVNSYILSRTLSGTYVLDDEYETNGNQFRNDKATNLATKVDKLQSKTIKLEQNVDNFAVELSDMEADVNSQFRVMAGEISMKIEAGEVSSTLSMEPGTVSLRSNRLIVESDNFKLYENGTAIFSGTVEAASIIGGDITGADIEGGRIISTSRNFRNVVEIFDGRIELHPGNSQFPYMYICAPDDTYGINVDPQIAMTNYDGNKYAVIAPDSIITKGANIEFRQGNLTVNGGGNIILSGGGSLTVDGYNVLTENSDLNASKITSGSMSVDRLNGTIGRYSNVKFGKYIQAVGNTGTPYELKLQSITINNTTYVLYAEAQ